jgi:D-alanyl-D-alanine carboxypeptidase
MRIARVTFFILSLCLSPVLALAAEPLRLNVESVMVMNLSDGAVLFEQDPDKPIPPASLTKLMTLFLVFDAVEAGKLRLDEPVRISRLAAKTGGTSMHLKANEFVTIDDLIHGMAVASANDACVAVAEHWPSGLKGFVEQMNLKALELGMRNTRFVNPNGLPAPGQHTTARDLLQLSARYLARYPGALRLHSIRSFTHNEKQSENCNRLLGAFPGADGLKTGFVSASGYNIAATARRGDTRLLAIVLGARTSNIRVMETRKIMEACFAMVDPALAYPRYQAEPAPASPLAPSEGREPHRDMVAAGLQREVSVGELESEHKSPRWLSRLKVRMKKTDALWEFCAPRSVTDSSCHKGYAIIRKGQIFYAVFPQI